MLFDKPKDNTDPIPSEGKSLEIEGSSFVPSSMKLDVTLDLLKPGNTIHWLSDGDWSMHDMLTALLLKSGPAAVYLSSYAFSEFPARLIAEHISKKLITSLHCVIDKRLDVRSASSLTIIKNVATRVELVNTHAKVTVIENKDFSFTVVGSANYTTNKRYESGIVTMDRAVALFHKNWILDAIDKGK